MARDLSRRIITFLLLFVCEVLTESPEIVSLKITNSSIHNYNDKYNEFELDLYGKNLQSNRTKIRITTQDAAKNEICKKTDSKIDYELSEVRTNNSAVHFKLRLAKSVCGNVYLCLLHEIVSESVIPPGMLTKTEQWYHQGRDIVVKVPVNQNCTQTE